jgi:hypothetical protein
LSLTTKIDKFENRTEVTEESSMTKKKLCKTLPQEMEVRQCLVFSVLRQFKIVKPTRQPG